MTKRDSEKKVTRWLAICLSLYKSLTIWKVNVKYKTNWYTLQKLTKPAFFSFRQSKNSPPFILLDPLYNSYLTTTFKVRITQTKVRSTQKYFPILKLCSILNFLIKYDSIQETWSRKFLFSPPAFSVKKQDPHLKLTAPSC